MKQYQTDLLNSEVSTPVAPSIYQKRDVGLDVARGIAMVLVVYGHALDGAQSAGHSSYLMRFVTILIYSTHIALFFQVAGLFARQVCSKPWPEFILSVTTRIIWPYLLWSFILLSVQFAMAGYTNGPLQVYHPLSILWHAPAVMWFLYVLCIAMIALRLLSFLPSWVILTVGVLLLCAPYLLQDWPDKSRFIGMFLIAAVAGPAILDQFLKPVVLGISAVIMGVTAIFASIAAHEPIIGYPASQAVYIPAIFAGPILIYWVSTFLLKVNPKGKLSVVLIAVGKNTMAIFVTHILVTAGVRIVLVGLGLQEWWLIILVATAAGVILPLAASHFVKRYGLSKWLGWQ